MFRKVSMKGEVVFFKTPVWKSSARDLTGKDVARLK